MALTLAIGFLVDDAIVFLENTVRLMEEGQNALEASLNSAKEISFTILTMTLSLAAVFIPLVFIGGLVGRIFREFSITIVISILASGIVSLTLTPLMTSRLLSQRGAGTKKTWVEKLIGGVERRVLSVYSRQLWFFLRYRWISAVIWFVCLFGTGYLFYTVPKSFLPVGDSSFIRGVLVGQEGSSPEQMHKYQDAAEKIMHANPAVASTFTMSGNGQFMPANQAFLIAFLKEPSQRAPIDQVAGQLMGGIMSTVPGALAFLQPNPVLEISTGATANVQGEFAYALSGIDPNEVYDASNKLLAKMHEYPGFLFVNSDLFNHTPNLQVDILRDQAKLYGVSETRILTLLHDAYSQNYSYLIKKTTDEPTRRT
jgi:HAE1 family hydrophobic/amphiphilic exporter-1